MSILANRQPKSKAKKRQRFFSITFNIEADSYAVSRLPADASVANHAFRFRKLTGDEGVYDVRVTEHGPECECKGYLRHGHCKHCETLQAAAGVFDLTPPPAPPQMTAEQSGRHHGGVCIGVHVTGPARCNAPALPFLSHPSTENHR